MQSSNTIHPPLSNTNHTSCAKSKSVICRSLYAHFGMEKWLIIAPHSHGHTCKTVGQMEIVLMPQIIHLGSLEEAADWQRHMHQAFRALVQICVFTTHTCHLLWLWLALSLPLSLSQSSGRCRTTQVSNTSTLLAGWHPWFVAIILQGAHSCHLYIRVLKESRRPLLSRWWCSFLLNVHKMEVILHSRDRIAPVACRQFTDTLMACSGIRIPVFYFIFSRRGNK